MRARNDATNPVEGRVHFGPVKSAWFAGMALTALVGGWLTFSWDAVAVSLVFTVFTLCFGHSVGLHRLLIHRSFACPKWLEYLHVHFGILVGMGGPFRVIYLHEIRDWAQRHHDCHPFFMHRNPLWKDAWWQLFCEIELKHPPEFVIERDVLEDRVFRFMQATWMLQQLPWAVLLYLLGGADWVVWGICVRVTVSLIGHWMVGYFAHNAGVRTWHLEGHAVQGYNLPKVGMISMGEGWHNNHHAFPGSARLGLDQGQHDPGWWLISLLKGLGLAWEVKLPDDLPRRRELHPLKDQ